MTQIVFRTYNQQVPNYRTTQSNRVIRATQISQQDYRLIFQNLKQIGQGSYGTIKRAQNSRGKYLAIKQFKDNQGQYGAFKQVSIMKKFNHPNILKLIAFYKIKETQKLLVVTEYCEHKSLKNFKPNLQGTSLQLKLRITFDIFNGIQALHSKNVMHRDLKPENILIDQIIRAKVCDFGFCRFDQEEDLQKSTIVGTPLYNSPQTQLGIYSKKCDIFSFGLVVYYIFSQGKHLFNYKDKQVLKKSRKKFFKNPSKQLSQLGLAAPQQIKKLILNSIAQKEQNRFQTNEVYQKMLQLSIQLKFPYTFTSSMQQSQWYKQSKKLINSVSQKQTQSQKKFYKNIKLILRNYNDHQYDLKGFQEIKSIKMHIAEFKSRQNQIKNIQKTHLFNSIEKYFVAFGALLRFYLDLQAFQQKTFKIYNLYKSNKQFIEFYKPTQTQIKVQKIKCGQNLLKMTKYVDQTKYLMKPAGIVTNYLINCINSIKKLESYFNLINNEQKQQNLKKSYDLKSLEDYHDLIQKQYHLKFDTKITNEIFNMINKLSSLSQQKDQKKLSLYVQSIRAWFGDNNYKLKYEFTITPNNS